MPNTTINRGSLCALCAVLVVFVCCLPWWTSIDYCDHVTTLTIQML